MHRASCLLAVLLMAACLPHAVICISLFQKLNSSSLVTQFTQLLQTTGLSNQMASGTCDSLRCFLVFVPSDAAMTAASLSDPAGYSSLDQTTLVKHHYITVFPGGQKGTLENWSKAGTPAGEDIGFGQVQILQSSYQSTLYWLAKQASDGTTSYRINNAAVVVASSNQDSDNGVFHVLDQVVLPIGTKQSISEFLASPNAAINNQLKVSKSINIFNQWMQRDTTFSYLYDAMRSVSTYKVRTLFLPSDAAWDRIPQDVFQQLNSSADNFRPVLVAHFGLNVCVFTSWMTPSSSIKFTTGHASVQTYQAKMYLDSAQRAFVSAGGVVAQFVDKSINYPIGDTVIHVVDRVLAFAYDTLATLAQANAPAFYSACVAVPSCQTLLTATDTPRTLFAPNDVSSLKNINASMLEQVLMMHFVPGVTGKPDMDDGDLLTSQNSAGIIRFRTALNKTRYYVEGRLPGRGFVRAELLMYDQPAKNGSIFHKITFPLGQPYRTIQDFINDFQDLSSVSSYMGSTGFDPNLGAASSMYTVFPPNNMAMAAFASAKSSTGTAVGQTIMKSQTLRDRVFRRVVLPNQKIVADILAAGATDYPTANTVENEKVNLNLKGSAAYSSRTADLTGVFVVTSVNLAAGEYECTNGMVYPVGNVLFRDNDVEGYARSATALGGSVVVAVFTLILTSLVRL